LIAWFPVLNRFLLDSFTISLCAFLSSSAKAPRTVRISSPSEDRVFMLCSSKITPTLISFKSLIY